MGGIGKVAKIIKTQIENFIIATVQARIDSPVPAPMYSPPGDDSPPLADDKAFIVKKDGAGLYVVLGTLMVSEGANPGEKILFSRDSYGVTQAKIYLKNDGTIEINGNADFAVAFNDLKTGFDQLVTDFNTHVHVESGGSTAPPTTPSAASIDTSKVTGVKLP